MTAGWPDLSPKSDHMRKSANGVRVFAKTILFLIAFALEEVPRWTSITKKQPARNTQRIRDENCRMCGRAHMRDRSIAEVLAESQFRYASASALRIL